jgi:AhpD family alkylhydroperoxidase
MNDPKEQLNMLNENLARFSKEWGKQSSAFFHLSKTIKSEGAVSTKTKELIAIGISVALRCEWCINSHVKSALDNGATKEEIMEAAWVAVLMGGGPALMYTQYVQNALDNLSK